MTVVGIDVSKGKSMVAAMKPGGELVAAPYEVRHSDIELSHLALDVLCMEPDTRVVMEATGRYHEPVATLLHSEGIFVSILNPLLIKQSGAGSLRKVKSDPKDALKLLNMGLTTGLHCGNILLWKQLDSNSSCAHVNATCIIRILSCSQTTLFLCLTRPFRV